MATESPEIRCHLSGTLPSIASSSSSSNETSQLRLIASLCMLQGNDELTLVNEPVEIAAVDRGQPPQEFDIRVAFQGLESAAVRHPLLEATVAKDTSPDLCVVLQLLSTSVTDESSQDCLQNILMFGGVSVDTQGLALGGEVRGTILLYKCVNESDYSNYMLRKVLESEGERMVRDGYLFRESTHVKLHVTASHRKTTASKQSMNNRHTSSYRHARQMNTAVSRSLINTWDRVGRNSVCIIVEVCGGLTVEQTNTLPQPYDISVSLVDRRGKVLQNCLGDAVGCSPAPGAIHLPRLWYPFPAGVDPEECWCHHVFTPQDIISTTANDSNIQLRICRTTDSVVDNRDQIPLRDWRGFNTEALNTVREFECNIESGLEFRITAQLFSNRIPASPAFASIVNCQGMNEPFPPGDLAQAVVTALSHDELIVSNFEEVEPFTDALLNGAFALIRLYPEDSNLCLFAFGFVMRLLAASYVVVSCEGKISTTSSVLEKKVKKWLNLHFEIPNIGLKLLRLIASAVDSKGYSVGLGSGTLGGDNSEPEDMYHQHQFWPSLISTPSSKNARTIISLTWVPLVKLAFRSHQCSGNVDSSVQQRTSVRILIAGVCKLLHSVAGWAAQTISSTPLLEEEEATTTTAIAREVTLQLHAVLHVVLEHQTDAVSILGPMEGFFHGFLNTNVAAAEQDSSAVYAAAMPTSAIFEVLKGISRSLSVQTVQQALLTSDFVQDTTSSNHIISFVLTLTAAVSRLLRNTRDHHADALVQAMSCLTEVVCLTKGNRQRRRTVWEVKAVETVETFVRTVDPMRMGLIDVLSSIPSRRPIKDARVKTAASMLVCAASEVFDRSSWLELRARCMRDDQSGGGFVYVGSMLGSDVTRMYSKLQRNAMLSNVGRGCVDLLQVMLSSSEDRSMNPRASSSLQRAAIKFAPSVQETLRNSVDSRTNDTSVVETLPAAAAALLLRHAQDCTTSSGGTSLLMSYEILWIESLVTLLGDVDAFVNDTASECLSSRLSNIVRIAEEALTSSSPSHLSSLKNVLDSLPRRVASRLHRLCCTNGTSSTTSTTTVGETEQQGIATSSVWWFKPWRVYHHVCGTLRKIVRVEMLANAMDRVAQVCLLYAQLWDAQPDVECQVRSPNISCKNHHAFTILLALGRMLCELGMIREASSCMYSAGCWYATTIVARRRTLSDAGTMLHSSCQHAHAMCQAVSSLLLHTSRDITTASTGMMRAARNFLVAKDVQRAMYCVDILRAWQLSDLTTKKRNGNQELVQQIDALTMSIAQQSTSHGSGRVGPWYFLVSFNGEGFKAYDPLLMSGTCFAYVVHAPYHPASIDATTDSDALILQTAQSMAMLLKEQLEISYYVFENDIDSISVLPAVEMYDSSSAVSTISAHFITMESDAHVISTQHVYEVSDPIVPFVTRLALHPIGLSDTSNKDRLHMWRQRLMHAPCLSPAWSCFDWSGKLCSREPLEIKTSTPVVSQDIPKRNLPSVNPLNILQGHTQARKADRIIEKQAINSSEENVVKEKTSEKKNVPKTTPKKSNLAALRRSRAKAKQSQKKKKKKKTPPPPREPKLVKTLPPPPKAKPITPAVETTETNALFDGVGEADVPAWLLGMQANLCGGEGGGGGSTNGEDDGDNSAPSPASRQSIQKASDDTKEAMAYARSLGAFMSPADAKQLMHSVKVEQKVVVDCVVTTDKGGKDAKAEVTPEGVKIFARGKGMFATTKILFKFELTKRLSAREAPTPKILMLMAPELNGEMLYINCEKRGVFKGAIAAFLQEQEDAAAAAAGGNDGGGGDDAWGPSGW